MKTAIVVVQAFLLSSCECLMVATAGPDDATAGPDEETTNSSARVTRGDLAEAIQDELSRVRSIIRRIGAHSEHEGDERPRESEVADDPKNDAAADDPKNDAAADDSKDDARADAEERWINRPRESEAADDPKNDAAADDPKNDAAADDSKDDARADADERWINRPREHFLTTWNAQGHVPTAEFLGGGWMQAEQGFYSDMEILTGVMMFRIAGCDVDFTQPAFKQYEKRYAAMYERYQTYEKLHRYEDSSTWDEDLSQISFEGLLYGLPKVLEKMGRTPTSKLELPSWVHQCSVKEALRNSLGLCKDPRSETDEESWACPFTLRSEGCWKARWTLPVYGKKFAYLLHSWRLPTVFWEKYVHGLEAQTAWGEDCHVDEHTAKFSTPGSHIKLPRIETPEPLTFMEWSMTAGWDALIMKLTTIASKLLVKMHVHPQETLNRLSPVTYIDDNQVSATKTELLVAGLFPSVQAPDVAFLQRAGHVDFVKLCQIAHCPGVAWRQQSTDTAIYVRDGFGGGIDEEDTQYAEAVWQHMVQSLRGAACEDSAEEGANSSKPCTRVHLPESLLELLTPGQRKNKIDFDTLGEPNRVTIAVTRSNPKLLLLSIHADEAGFFGPTYLSLATKLYDAMAEEHCLSGMYVGMSANLQAGAGHRDFSEKKGFSFEQFQNMVPEGMRMLRPMHRTVSKVRTFLQPFFEMIAKEEHEVTDVLFIYPTGSNFTMRTPTVYNSMLGGILRRDGEETANYPTNGWPADHFLVSGSVDSQEAERKLPGAVGDRVGRAFLSELA